MDVLELAKERRRALISEIERLEALIDGGAYTGEPVEQQAESALIVPFPERQRQS